MVWETVKKEMTITRILLVVVAILLCCYLTFGLPHKSEKNQEKNEERLMKRFREYLEKNHSNPEHPGEKSPEGIHDDTKHNAEPYDATKDNTEPHDATKDNTELYDATTTSSKPRKFYSVMPTIKKSETVVTTHSILDFSKGEQDAPLVHPTNTSNNDSESDIDIVIVVDSENQQEHENEDSQLVEVKNTATKHVDRVMTNHLLFSKTVRVSKVEEVFEDIQAQNVRRIIKEDRVERVEVSKNKEFEAVGTELGIKDLLSL